MPHEELPHCEPLCEVPSANAKPLVCAATIAATCPQSENPTAFASTFPTGPAGVCRGTTLLLSPGIVSPSRPARRHRIIGGALVIQVHRTVAMSKPEQDIPPPVAPAKAPVRCFKCGTFHDQSAQDCVKCGSHLWASCRRCRARNPRTYSLCPKCGNQLRGLFGGALGTFFRSQNQWVRYVLILLAVIAGLWVFASALQFLAGLQLPSRR